MKMDVPFEYQVYGNVSRQSRRAPKWLTVRETISVDVPEISGCEIDETFEVSGVGFADGPTLGGSVGVLRGRAMFPVFACLGVLDDPGDRDKVAAKVENLGRLTRMISSVPALDLAFSPFYLTVGQTPRDQILKAEREEMVFDPETLRNVTLTSRDYALRMAVESSRHLAFVDGRLHTGRYEVVGVDLGGFVVCRAIDSVEARSLPRALPRCLHGGPVVDVVPLSRMDAEMRGKLRRRPYEPSFLVNRHPETLVAGVDSVDVLSVGVLRGLEEELLNPTKDLDAFRTGTYEARAEPVEEMLSIQRRALRAVGHMEGAAFQEAGEMARNALGAMADILDRSPDHAFGWSRVRLDRLAGAMRAPGERKLRQPVGVGPAAVAELDDETSDVLATPFA